MIMETANPTVNMEYHPLFSLIIHIYDSSTKIQRSATLLYFNSLLTLVSIHSLAYSRCKSSNHHGNCAATLPSGVELKKKLFMWKVANLSSLSTSIEKIPSDGLGPALSGESPQRTATCFKSA